MPYRDLNHVLTEQDIEQIVDRVCDKLERKMYLNIGKGLMGIIWKLVVMSAIALAGYGAGVHWFK